jgi:son of sevenless-like protein
MTTVATPLYPPFSTNANHGQPGHEEQYISTFFCRALYDYQAKDASSLSFHKNDIIEVLTQLESGWWDGLLGDERGWFPSNYVQPISDEEAESVLSGSEFSVIHPPTSNESLVDMSLALSSQLERDREWLATETESSGARNGTNEPAFPSAGGTAQSSDFWMPQVTSDAQVCDPHESRIKWLIKLLEQNYYYVNTQTGQQSRDIPREADGEVSDSDLAGLTQLSSRAGSSAGLGLGASEDGSTQAGFGVPRHSGTPEPWVRRLADDGRAYYYQNKLDGQVQSTLPPSAPSRVNGQQRSHARETPTMRSEPATSQAKTQRPPDHLSIYSDDSDVEPSDIDQPTSFSTSQSSLHDPSEQRQSPSLTFTLSEKRPAIQLTPAERLAHSLQQAVAPPPPELVTELSDIARNAISTVVTRVQRIGIPRAADGDSGIEDLINAVVVSVRDLLYISAPPSGSIPSDVLPAHARDPPVNNASQAMLKPALRKVTATLSKLVLSARAIQFESGTSTSDAPLRIEADAEELERAIVAFVLEVQRTQNRALVEQIGPTSLKRLRGVFLTSNIGLGLVGAGAAGSWKGFGWVALDESDERPGRILGTEVLSELETHMTKAEERFNAFTQAFHSNLGDIFHSVTKFTPYFFGGSRTCLRRWENCIDASLLSPYFCCQHSRSPPRRRGRD